jgi:hypothetical protein
VRIAEFKCLVKDQVYQHDDIWLHLSPFQDTVQNSLYGGKVVQSPGGPAGGTRDAPAPALESAHGNDTFSVTIIRRNGMHTVLKQLLVWRLVVLVSLPWPVRLDA